LSSTINGWDRAFSVVGSCHHPFEDVTHSISSFCDIIKANALLNK